ncbi:MAG: methionine--tRNA ligase [Candidatus Dojkabacteria bacterium]
MNTTKRKKIFIGVAWPYVNGNIHVGHLAGYLIPSDIFSRFVRLSGHDTLMVSGSDCHGTPITVAADKKGVTPQKIVDEFEPKLHELIKLYGISYDLFTSTRTENHANTTREVFLNLLQNGYIIRKTSAQYYSEQDNKFLPDRYVEGQCPYCHALEQRADQCENCGRTLESGELINPVSKLTGSEVSLKDSQHYYIDLPALEKDLKNFVDASLHWRKWVRQETVGWLKEGLQPRAITRDIDWGIKIPVEQIPEHDRIEHIESKRFYVWFEAVIGYLSAAIEWSTQTGNDWKEFWLHPDTKHYYFMGKDNLAFHTIIWPAQLIGQGKGYNLPYFPAINHFLNLEDKKFSKSRGVFLDSYSVGKYFGVDQVRFYLASILPESRDTNWKWDDFQATINNELVGTIGNFIHRVLVFYKNKIPGTACKTSPEVAKAVQQQTEQTFTKVCSHLEQCEFIAALNEILAYSKFGNQYFDHHKPWENVKKDPNKTWETIFNCLQIVQSLSVLLAPFTPEASAKLRSYLSLEPLEGKPGEDRFTFSVIAADTFTVADNIAPLFRKIELEAIEDFQNKIGI